MGHCWVMTVAACCQVGGAVGRAAAIGGELTWTAQSALRRVEKHRSWRGHWTRNLLDSPCDLGAQEAEGPSLALRERECGAATQNEPAAEWANDAGPHERRALHLPLAQMSVQTRPKRAG